MQKYHINPQTLEPTPCCASEGRCPYGAQTIHIGEDRIGEHFKLYEQVMADYSLVSFRKEGDAMRRRYDHLPGQPNPRVI